MFAELGFEKASDSDDSKQMTTSDDSEPISEEPTTNESDIPLAAISQHDDVPQLKDDEHQAVNYSTTQTSVLKNDNPFSTLPRKPSVSDNSHQTTTPSRIKDKNFEKERKFGSERNLSEGNVDNLMKLLRTEFQKMCQKRTELASSPDNSIEQLSKVMKEGNT